MKESGNILKRDCTLLKWSTSLWKKVSSQKKNINRLLESIKEWIMRGYVERLKKYYSKGLYTYDSMIRLLDLGIITEEEFHYIVGD